jgi:hypothetical protein
LERPVHLKACRELISQIKSPFGFFEEEVENEEHHLLANTSFGSGG